MIVTNLIGGLGNQMFQYAVGRSLSLARGVPLLLDVADFAGYKLHQGFELQRLFACQAGIADEATVRRMLGWQALPLSRRILGRSTMAALRREAFVVEPHFHYWPEIERLSSEAYLSGYWQSEKYFSDVAETIRRDFSFVLPMSRQNEELAERIAGTCAVSLHVRRGDYVNNPKAAANHGVCSLDYYQAAIRHIADRIGQPTFFVFSDDPDWVKVNLRMDHPCCYIDHNRGAESYNDMRLMSLCQHHIIANSSFSWWGAWLDSAAEGITIAPQKWFANTNDVSDLIPAKWITL